MFCKGPCYYPNPFPLDLTIMLYFLTIVLEWTISPVSVLGSWPTSFGILWESIVSKYFDCSLCNPTVGLWSHESRVEPLRANLSASSLPWCYSCPGTQARVFLLWLPSREWDFRQSHTNFDLICVELMTLMASCLCEYITSVRFFFVSCLRSYFIQFTMVGISWFL